MCRCSTRRGSLSISCRELDDADLQQKRQTSEFLLLITFHNRVAMHYSVLNELNWHISDMFTVAPPTTAANWHCQQELFRLKLTIPIISNGNLLTQIRVEKSEMTQSEQNIISQS